MGRGFHRKKYDGRKTIESFAVKLHDETDFDALNNELAGRWGTMLPEHVPLWLRPVFLLRRSEVLVCNSNAEFQVRLKVLGRFRASPLYLL
jgi:hypothetical protein